MSTLDIVLSLTIVAAAMMFLVYQWARGKSAPACHTVAGPMTTAKGPDVIVGAALARGLAKARARGP